MQSVETGKPHIRSRSSAMIFLPFASLMVLAIGWSVFWYIASAKTESLLDAWIEREKHVGRVWTCPERQIGGYPFRIEIRCAKPQFEAEASGTQFKGSLAGFYAVSKVYQPGLTVVEIEGPFTMQAADGSADISLKWRELHLSLRGLPETLSRLSLAGEEVSLRGTVAEIGTLNLDAANVEAHLAAADTRQDQAYDIYVALNEASIPLLDDITGSSAKAAIQLDGTISQADFGGAGRLPDRIEKWRMAGGQVELSRASLVKGTLNFKSKGTLALDVTHRLDGTLESEFSGLEPVLLHYGVDPGLLTVGSLLNNLLGQKRDGARAAEPRPLRLPLVINHGQIAIGPVRTPIRLPPLY
jgi:hypothetical protein